MATHSLGHSLQVTPAEKNRGGKFPTKDKTVSRRMAGNIQYVQYVQYEGLTTANQISALHAGQTLSDLCSAAVYGRTFCHARSSEAGENDTVLSLAGAAGQTHRSDDGRGADI
jgi:hypothetical protein